MYVFIVLSLQCNAFKLISVWLDPYDVCVKLYSQVISLLLSTTFFLPSRVFVVWTKAEEKPCQDPCLSDNQQQHLLPLKGQDTQSTGRKQWNWLEWWWWTMQEGGCQVLWSGIMLPTPTTRPLFLPAMYCSLHLSHYETHLLKEGRQNNETMKPCTLGRGASCKQLVTRDVWFLTPSLCFLILVSFTFNINSNLTSHCEVFIWCVISSTHTLQLGFKIKFKPVNFSNLKMWFKNGFILH